MKALLLGAGCGERLWPFTDDVPKILAPICDVPLLDYHLSLLTKQGFSECLINTHYKADLVEQYIRAVASDIEVSTFYERKLTGPAGGARCLVNHIPNSGSVIVVSGDAFHDIALDELYHFHNRSSARITIATTEVCDPGRYGVLKFDKDKNVTEYVEKPRFLNSGTAWINCGIYCVNIEDLKTLPGGFADFGAQLIIPLLKRELDSVKVFPVSNYWRDIGTPNELRCASLDVVTKKILIPKLKAKFHPEFDDVLVGTDGEIGLDTKFKGPCYVGKNATIGRGCCLRSTVVLAHTIVDVNTKVSHSILGKFYADE